MSLSGTVLGIALPVATAIAVSHNLAIMAGWGAGLCDPTGGLRGRSAGLPNLAQDIPRGKVAWGLRRLIVAGYRLNQRRLHRLIREGERHGTDGLHQKQFIDILQWTEEGDGVLAWRYPMQISKFSMARASRCRESQMAVFVNEGKVADVFSPACTS